MATQDVKSYGGTQVIASPGDPPALSDWVLRCIIIYIYIYNQFGIMYNYIYIYVYNSMQLYLYIYISQCCVVF